MKKVGFSCVPLWPGLSRQQGMLYSLIFNVTGTVNRSVKAVGAAFLMLSQISIHIREIKNKIETVSLLLVVVLLCAGSSISFGQTCTGINPGQIFQPATTSGQKIMNPSLDGWVTKFPDFVPPQSGGTSGTCGFNLNYPTSATYNCINQFEFQMFGIPEIGTGDVLNDNIGSSCGITDLIPDNKGYSVYAIRKTDPTNASLYNLIFRFRLGAFNSSVEAYSILIDTDQKFGHVGDAGVTASTADPNWTAGNPGFELEITLINNSNGNSGGVFVYDIDGIDSCPTPLATYAYDSHVQISQADSKTCNDADYFFDFYVPLEEVKQKFNQNRSAINQLTDSSPLRYAALTNQNAGCAMQGRISDISGVDNSSATYSTHSTTGIYNSFLALVSNQCGTPLTDLVPGAGGFDKDVTHAPKINGPLNVGQTVVTGTTCNALNVCEPGIFIRIDVYHALASPLSTPPQTPRWSQTQIDPRTTPPAGKVTEGPTETTWAITLNAPLLPYDSVVATTQKSETTYANCAGNGGNTSSSSTAVVVKCLLEATLTSTNVSCNGSADGSIAAIISPSPYNGTAPYTYLWSNNQTTSTASNLAPGTYSVIIKDVQKCQAIVNPVTITQQPALTATVSFTNVTCNGANDGTIIVSSPSGGYGTFQYSINGGSTWQGSGSFTNLGNATYNVMIRDAAHTSCIADLDGVANTSITQPASLNATVSSVNISCNGSSDGSIIISSPSGGSGSYEFSVNGGTWQSSLTFTGLPAGTFSVTMRDAAHVTCTKNLGGASNITITQPPALSATVSSSNVTCNGASDGSITVTSPSGGYGTYQYSINGGVSWQASGNFTNLANATYNVMIRDAAHTTCAIDLDGSNNTTITQPSALTASLSSTSVSCSSATDGIITVSSPSGGSGSYEYSINGGGTWQSSGAFTGLSGGTYDVRIRDAAHPACAKDIDGSANTTITQPAALGASISSTSVSCNGASDGTITISAPTGGYGTFQYSINGGSTWQGLGTFTNLSVATYNVMIRDAAHTSCTADLDGTINTAISQPAALNATISSANVSCNGASDGSITISSPSGGSGSYEFSVNGGTWQSSLTFGGLPVGTYSVFMRDAARITCTKNLGGASNISITQPSVLSATISSSNVTCNGANDGSISITSPSGGYGTYDYSINGGGSWQASGSFINLANATYNVMIRDAAHTNCSIDLDGSTNTKITQPSPLAASVTSSNVSCSGSSDGSITISSPAGGSGSYQYSINGGGTWSSSNSFTGLANGTYDVRIRDAAHTSCAIDLDGSSNTSISQPPALGGTVSTTSVTCNGTNNGVITISSSTGGYGSYQYSINGGSTWQSSGSFTTLLAGTYDVRIRDAAHTSCSSDLDGSTGTTVTQPAALHATVSSTNATCNGGSNGAITITSASGGSGTYQFSINGGSSWQSSGSFSGLSAGTYDVRMRDAAHTSCSTDLDGSSGTTFTQPAALNATVSSSNVTCNGSSDGAITISSPVGGSGGYQYSINGGTSWQSSGSFTGLASGTYNVMIRDAASNSCLVDLDGGGNTSITQPNVLNASVNSTNVSFNGANDGSITINSPTGGHGTYQFSINGGASWQSSTSYTGLSNGAYNVMMRDAAHIACFVALGNVSITQPGALSASVATTNVTCHGGSDGAITISSPTGATTYEYSIDGGSPGGTWHPSGSFTGLAAGSTYDVHIRDAGTPSNEVDLDGSANTTISQPPTLTAVVTASNVTCNGAGDGQINITSAGGGYGTYGFTIDGGTTWQSSGSFAGLVANTYDVRIRDAAHISCSIDLDGTTGTTIAQPAILNATVTPTNVSCSGMSDGAITLSSPSGGSSSFQFSINGGTSWQLSNSFTTLSGGTYDVRIRDAAQTSCSIDLDGTTGTNVIQPSALGATISSTNVTCVGTNDGTITVTSATGGYGTYQYSINGGSSWQPSGSFVGLSGSTFDVRIRDAANTTCSIDLDGSTGSIISQPPSPLNANVSSTNVTCNGASDGTITISSSSGGYGTYEYSINGGTSWQALGSFNNLAANTYSVSIRDAAHASCTADIDGTTNTIISQPTVLNATVVPSNVTCNGANDGTITLLSPSGGSNSFQFSINGGTSWTNSTSFNGLANGSYNVMIRDLSNNSCFVDLDGAGNTSITQPATLTATLASTNISCNGATDGKITIGAAAGGSGSFEYSVDGGSNWFPSGAFTGLALSTYNVLVRDASHTSCTIDLDGSSNTSITQPATLSATVASTNLTCFGSNNGTISVTSPQGGYGTYQYSDDGGTTWQPTGSFTGLANGIYDVRIRDGANTPCSVDLGSSNALITQPSALSATLTSTNVTSFGANDGSISVTSPIGGSGSYEYSNNGGSSWNSSGTFSGLSGGTYNVQIRDAASTSCSFDLDGTLNTNVQQPTAPLTATLSSTNISCNGSSDGTITISSPVGGYGTYEYTINGGTSWSSSGSFTGLPSGTYNAQVRDANYPSDFVDLDGSVNTSIGQPTTLSASVSSTNVSCQGSSDGSIVISNPVGGSGSYEYSINGGTSWSPLGSFTSLAIGNYNIAIRDAAHPGCVTDLDGNASGTAINQPAALSATVSVANVSSPGLNDGAITISSPSGGYGTYQFSIDGGTTWQSSGSFTGLASGNYHVSMRDGAHITCSISLDGALGNTVVAQPSALGAAISSSNVTCNGASDGQINITSSTGGYGTYEYSVNGGTSWQASSSFTALANGSYNVLIRDAAYPTNVVDLDGTANTTITQPTLLSAIISFSNLTSGGGNDGTISISSPAGGYGTYQYSIDAGTSWQNAGNFSGLASGTYSVSIRDAAHTNCVIDLDGSTNTNLLPPLGVAVTSYSNINCFGRNNGSLTVNGFYGVPPYTYSIDGTTFSTQNTFSSLTSGSYTLWAKDSNGSTASTSATVGQPTAALSASATAQKNAQCFGTDSGSITALGANGTGPYTYSRDGATFVINNLFTDLSAGTYTITVLDANGCSATTTATIAQPDQISASAVAVSINGDDNGSVATIADGGTPPYTYSWTGPDGFIAATDTIKNLVPGVYSVVVTDANQCISGIASYTIIFKIYEGVSPNGDGKNDYWRIEGIEGYPDNLVRIFDRFSNLVFETRGYSNESNNWSGQSNHGLVRGTLPDGTYFYTVNLGDGKGTKSGYVILKRQ